MTFAPVNSDHSVTSASFNLVLSEGVPTSFLNDLKRDASAWTQHLPAMKEPKGFLVHLTEDGPTTVEHVGLEFAFLRPDGRAAWAFRILNNTIMVECGRYTRWESVFSQVTQHLAPFLDRWQDKWPQARLNQVQVVMRDSYLWFGDRATYDLGQLLVPGDFTAPRIFDVGPVWHCNTAWFEADDGGDTLNALNLSSVHSDELCQARDAAAHVQISHALDFRRHEGLPISAETRANFDEQFANVCRGMHARNKELLSQILVEDMAHKIGLMK